MRIFKIANFYRVVLNNGVQDHIPGDIPVIEAMSKELALDKAKETPEVQEHMKMGRTVKVELTNAPYRPPQRIQTPEEKRDEDIRNQWWHK